MAPDRRRRLAEKVMDLERKLARKDLGKRKGQRFLFVGKMGAKDLEYR